MTHFFSEFWGLLTDPAHVALEFCFVLLDYLIIQTLVSRVKRHFHKDLAVEHLRIEAEHGLVHPRPDRKQRPTPRPPVGQPLTGGYPSSSRPATDLPAVAPGPAPGSRPYDYERSGW